MATGRVPTTANSPLTAKGDLFTYSTTPARLAVGNNGETLVADSSTSTGLRWQAPVQQNPILNSAMQLWQRGTSIAVSGFSAYTADRWFFSSGSNSGRTVSRQLTNDTTNLPFIQYCSRVQRDSGNTGATAIIYSQSLETINSIPYVGKTITLSFYARAGANFSSASSALGFQLQYGTGTDQNIQGTYTGATNVISSSATLTTTWQRFTATATIPTAANELGIQFFYTAVGTAGAADFFEITGVQLEVGSVATPFKTYAATIQGELAACQRYYYRLNAGGAFSRFALGIYSASTGAEIVVNVPVTLRSVPTAVETSTIGNYFLTDSVNNQALTGMGISTHSTLNTILITPSISGGGTQFRPAELISNNSTTTYLGFSAEL